ncbi:hypothetical protein [Phenylobacterium sp.]|uniref:hypothetical protein n=1 Tax=Phenylobacterium sp. TaxID=1871053 RepID=UPI00273293AC|nr:hypothetical protein [Phenylobacterium sp.]MDP3855869.1 hypothetical protein [Phenylobacterium sp.]
MRAGLLLSLLLATAAQAQEATPPLTLDDFLKPEQTAEAPPPEAPAVQVAPAEAASVETAPVEAAPEQVAPAESAPVEPGPVKPAPADAAAPTPAKPKTLVEALAAVGFDPKTKVDGGNVQVMQGQRALFRLDARAAPVLGGVDTGKLGAAQPEGEAETYKGSGAGRIGVALDSSPVKKQSYMKIWNGLARPVTFELELAAVRGGQLMRRKASGCAVPAGGVHSQSWPDPIIAVTVSKVAPAARDATPCS